MMNNNNRDVLLKIAEAIKDTTTIEQAVGNWLEDHPEATTTVQDGSITKAKLDENLQETVDDVSDLKSALNDVINLETESNSGLIATNGVINTASSDYQEVYSQMIFAPTGSKIRCVLDYSKIRNGFICYGVYDQYCEFIERVTAYASNQTWVAHIDNTYTVSTQGAYFVRVCYRSFGDILTGAEFEIQTSLQGLSEVHDISDNALSNVFLSVFIRNQGYASVEYVNSDYSVNITISDTLAIVRNGTAYNFANSDIATALPNNIVSTSGTAAVVNIPSGKVLVFDSENNTLSIIDRAVYTSSKKYVSLVESNGKALGNGMLMPFMHKITDTELNAQLNQIRNIDAMVYFSGSDQPTFIEAGTAVSVLMPPYADFRVYKRNGGIVVNTVLGDTPYTVPNFKKLVLTSQNALSVIDITTNNQSDIILITNSGGSIGGLLKPFYDKWKSKKNAVDETIESSEFTQFVFFSDIHKATRDFKRIVNYANAHSVDAIINGGDTVQANMGEGLTWYNNIVDTANMDVLACVGNHDEWVSDWVTGTATDVYNLVIAPIASKVTDLVQPNSAAENGLQYYYKDYGSVRVIVLNAGVVSSDDIFWTAQQLSWFESVLADAKTNTKHVICVNHAPYYYEDATRIGKRWNSYIDYTSGTVQAYDGLHVDDEAISAVNDFITGGGIFICWLSGHVHLDNLLCYTDHQSQMMIDIASANYSKHTDGLHTDNEGYSYKQYYDCFNHISVDTTRKMIRVKRVGFNTDYSLNVRNYLCYDYNSHSLMNEE